MDEYVMRAGDETPVKLSSRAEGFMDMDLNRRYIVHRAATYLYAAEDGAIEMICRGDMLIVDRAILPKPGHVIIASLDGEMVVRRLLKLHGRLALVTDTGEEPPFFIRPGLIYSKGVVTAAIHSLI